MCRAQPGQGHGGTKSRQMGHAMPALLTWQDCSVAMPTHWSLQQRCSARNSYECVAEGCAACMPAMPPDASSNTAQLDSRPGAHKLSDAAARALQLMQMRHNRQMPRVG